jgi:putative membrane-bound dehydrogenase-like protein
VSIRRTAAVAVAGLALCYAAGTPSGQTGPSGPPYPPEQALATLRVEPGFRVELVAAEPDVQSPVAMDIDEDGRIFVVEMPGYPLDVSPSGRVRLLEDTDGDGRVDRSALFADRLVLPSGVMRWKDGILVTSPPDLLFLADRDGDGYAEHREVVLTGFAKTNPQHAVNHPVYGLDNWVYLAHSGGSQPVIYADLFGDQGSPLTFPARPDVPALDPRGRGVRVKPDAFRVEGLSSRTQYGNAFDVYGRYFAHNNSVHARHEVIAARYLERNPQLLLSSAMADISDHGNANIIPITHAARFDLLTEAGQFTSACGLTLYNGGAFPAAFDQNAFVAEPVHNLVHRDVYRPDGATFVASRGRDDMEFLASTDSWFRPVNFYVGPDGALYVIDYYRLFIEHPEWASSDLQQNPEVMSTGSDRGRIYRIVAETPEAQAALARRPALGSASDADLVAALADANGWWRRTAQRLLVTRGRTGAVPALEAMVEARPTPLARLHALWTLEGLGRLDPRHVLPALADPDPGIRENAIVLAERWVSEARVVDALVAMAGDPDARVRFQLLATLGFVDTPASHAVQERLLFDGIEDQWMQVAALSASADRAAAYLARALSPEGGLTRVESPGRAAFFDRLGGVIAARGRPEELARVMSAVRVTEDAPRDASDDAWWQAALLEGVARGTTDAEKGRQFIQPHQDALLTLATGTQPRLRRAAVTLLGVSGVTATPSAGRSITLAARTAADVSADVEARADAVKLLAIADPAAHRASFERLIEPSVPDAVQVAAVQALGRGTDDDAVATFLLARWPTLTSAVRTAAATVILSRPAGARAMIAALEDGRVEKWMLNFWHKRSLIMHRDPEIRAAGRALLEESPEARAQVVARYEAALTGRGDAARGARVFERECSMCHQIDGQGGLPMGPDLSTIRHRPMPLLLADILEPSRSIAQHYETYQVERASGDTIMGVIGEQSPTSITFRQGPGQEVTVNRSDIRQMSVVPQSTMPEGLDAQITPEEMADLLAYLTRSER